LGPSSMSLVRFDVSQLSRKEKKNKGHFLFSQ
jgi:hypothetical protein